MEDLKNYLETAIIAAKNAGKFLIDNKNSDKKVLVELINSRIDLGIQLDSSICSNFEKRTKSSNYLFSKSIDFIYEFFNFESKTNTALMSKSVQLLGKNKSINRFLTKMADTGFVI